MNEKVLFTNSVTGGEVTLLIGADGVFTPSQLTKFKRHVWGKGMQLKDVSGLGHDTNNKYKVKPMKRHLESWHNWFTLKVELDN